MGLSVASTAKRAGLWTALCAALALAVSPARAADSDRIRYYLGLRLGEKIPPLSKATDIGGGVLGVNLNRFFGAELALDSYEYKVEPVSELSALAIVPHGRVRYPLLHDRLTPYLIGGVGLVVTQGNDAREPVSWQGGRTSVHPMGSVGGGIEYFISDNVAVGVEGKYLVSDDVTYTTTKQTSSFALSTGLFTLGLRVFYPQIHAVEVALPSVYFGLRTGATLLVDSEPWPGVTASPEQPIFGSDLQPMFGGYLGMMFTPHVGAELSVENYELSLRLKDVGGIGEYAVFPIVLQGRYAYPVGRWLAYGLAGVGGELGQLNDKTPAARQLPLDVEAKDIAVVGTFAAGVDYAVMSNVAVTGEVKYVISRGHAFEVGGVTSTGNLDSLLFSVGIRVVLWDR